MVLRPVRRQFEPFSTVLARNAKAAFPTMYTEEAGRFNVSSPIRFSDEA